MAGLGMGGPGQNPESLVDALVKTHNFKQRGGFWSRVFFIGGLTGKATVEQVQGLADEMVQGQTATGVALVYPRYITVVVELPTLALFDFLQSVKVKFAEVMSSCKLLLVSDAHKQRFDTWHSATFDLTSSKTAEYQSADSLETTIGDLVTTVLRLSRELKSGEKV